MTRPITPKTAASNGVAVLKWLVVPRHAWPAISTTSRTSAAAVPVPTTRRIRGQSGRKVKTHASVNV